MRVQSIHCVMKPIRIQVECPYNFSNKYTHVWVFMVLYSLHKQCTFCISAHMREAASTNVLLVFYNSDIATRRFIPWMNQFLNESSDPVIHRSHLFTLLKKTIEPCPKHNRKCNGYNGNCIGFNGNYDGVYWYLMDSIGGGGGGGVKSYWINAQNTPQKGIL